MPTIVRDQYVIEWDFARKLAGFFPAELTLGKDFIGYPYVRKRGLKGYFKGALARFSGEKRVRIKNGKWRGTILEAVMRYEHVHDFVDVTIEDTLSYF